MASLPLVALENFRALQLRGSFDGTGQAAAQGRSAAAVSGADGESAVTSWIAGFSEGFLV